MNKLEILSNIIKAGRENAIPRSDLSELLSLPDRETRLLVSRLRKCCAICSDEAGYYRPANIDELNRYCRKCRKRRRTDYETNKAAEMQLRQWEEQAAFDGATLLDNEEVQTHGK